MISRGVEAFEALKTIEQNEQVVQVVQVRASQRRRSFTSGVPGRPQKVSIDIYKYPVHNLDLYLDVSIAQPDHRQVIGIGFLNRTSKHESVAKFGGRHFEVEDQTAAPEKVSSKSSFRCRILTDSPPDNPRTVTELPEHIKDLVINQFERRENGSRAQAVTKPGKTRFVHAFSFYQTACR
jgi:hypothetical protein